MLESKTLKETNRYELKLRITAEEFEKAVAKVFEEKKGMITIPGFRKGKAPRALVEKRYGADIFYEDAFNDVYRETVVAGVEESGLTVVSSPEINVESIGREGAVFTATVWTEPEIEIENYKGIKVDRPSVDVSDGEVSQEIDRARDRNARISAVEGPAENGHIAVIDFEGFIDGAAFEGGSAKGHSLVLGSGSFINGFEEQVVGHSAGDEFDVSVKFPDDYGIEEVKGKEAVFKTKLVEVKKREVPELDSDFVKDVSDKDTVEEYTADVRERLQDRKNKAADRQVREEVRTAIAGLVKGDIPKVMIENNISAMAGDFEYQLSCQGIKLDDYLAYIGKSQEEFLEQYRAPAEIETKYLLALKKIAELENIEATDEEVRKEYRGYTDHDEKDGEAEDPGRLKSVREGILAQKAEKAVLDAAVINQLSDEDKNVKAKKAKAKEKEDKAPQTEKKPVKKAASKKEKPEKAEKEEKPEKDAGKQDDPKKAEPENGGEK